VSVLLAAKIIKIKIILKGGSQSTFNFFPFPHNFPLFNVVTFFVFRI